MNAMYGSGSEETADALGACSMSAHCRSERVVRVTWAVAQDGAICVQGSH